MPRLTKAQKIEKAEKYLGLSDPVEDKPLTAIQRIGRLAVAFNAKRQEFDTMEQMIASVIGSFLTEKPRNG